VRLRRRVLAGAALLALAAAACGDNGTRDAPTESPVAALPERTAVATATASPTAAPPASITIAAVGDVSLARELVQRMEVEGAGYPYALVRDALADADITLANLEGALTDGGEAWPKGYNFRTPPRFAPGLRDAGVDIVSLANNHTMDYGVAGLLDTTAALRAAGVAYAGAGEHAEEALQPGLFDHGDLTVAFLACAATPQESGGFAISEWAAGVAQPGLWVCDSASIDAAVRSAKEAAEFVVLTAHAGDEYRTAPNATQRQIAEAALAAGADVVIMHHAHVVQPIERRGGAVVAWGLGNFIFDLDEVDLANIPAPRVSLILRLTLTEGAGVTGVETVPVTLDAGEDRPRPATAEEAAVLQSLVTP
jgi:poly-gamma-glutamate synthesis protein (capsule biosynthesis protein)